jgi:hypothetical protein
MILVYLGRWSYGRFKGDNNIFYKMKNDLTTGTWQDDIWCPIIIVLFCTSDEGRRRRRRSSSSRRRQRWWWKRRSIMMTFLGRRGGWGGGWGMMGMPKIIVQIPM